MLCSIDLQLVTDVSGKTVRLIFKNKAEQEDLITLTVQEDLFTLRHGTVRFSRNVGY
jgi:hypothetical protein